MFDRGETLVVVVLVAIAALIAGGCIGGCCVDDAYQRQAIERGYAEHDAKTGEWKWKENEATDGR